MNRIIISTLIAIASVSAYAQRDEGRGEHSTRVTCASVKSLRDAQACITRVAAGTPSENDPSAAVISAASTSKKLLIEILRAQGKVQDIAKVQAAAYVAAVVQNDDEASIYYYTLKNGARVKPTLVGNVIGVVDLQYDVCPSLGPVSFPTKFRKVRNQLLGMDSDASLGGTIWLDDISCEE